MSRSNDEELEAVAFGGRVDVLPYQVEVGGADAPYPIVPTFHEWDPEEELSRTNRIRIHLLGHHPKVCYESSSHPPQPAWNAALSILISSSFRSRELRSQRPH